MTIRAPYAAALAAVLGFTPGSAANASPIQASPAPPDCSRMFQATGASGGAITARDLAELRDMGPSALNPAEGHIFTLSPDRKSLAVQVRRANPDTNDFCQAVVVLPVSGSGPVRIIDIGGRPILAKVDMLGRAGVETGLTRAIEPVWSPDGQRIAFLKDTHGAAQVWIAETNGSEGHAATDAPADVVHFAFDADGRTIIFAVPSAIAAQREAIGDEGRQGYRFDARNSPGSGPVPFAKPDGALAYFSNRPGASAVPATADQIKRLGSSDTKSSAADSKERAIRFITDGGVPLLPTLRLHAVDEFGRDRVCLDPACTSTRMEAWWTQGGQRVRFLRREGGGGNMTAIYEWRPGAHRAKRMMATTSLLIDCQPLGDRLKANGLSGDRLSGDALICLEETSLQPRRLVRFDRKMLRKTVLFDPNPGFARLQKSRVERLFWRNAFGIETFGDLVYPLGYRAAGRYPLVVVQYTSRGFLRGGTGDEFPIQAFAARGYFVLSLQRPDALALTSGARTSEEADAQLLGGFRDRRSVLSSIETVLERLVAKGLVDRKRIGITGLSDGSSTVQFAAVNSDLFAAGSVSGCCWERSQDFLLNEGIADHFARSGWPRLGDDNVEFWRHISLAQNAGRIRFPLLFQMADEEYLGALESVTALRRADHPVDMYVFPGEHHIKWQAAHKLAAYQRNLDWFDFWLRRVLPSNEMERETWTSLRRGWLERQRAEKTEDASAQIQGLPDLSRATSTNRRDAAGNGSPSARSRLRYRGKTVVARTQTRDRLR